MSLSVDDGLTLFTALGNVELVFELVDFLSKGGQYQYAMPDEAENIQRQVCTKPLARVILVCTKTVREKMAEVNKWLAERYHEVDLELVELDCDDIRTAGDDEAMREKVYEAVKSYAGQDLVISSGGRKTITQRIVEAGLFYGCKAYLSITEGINGGDGQLLNVFWIPMRRFVEQHREHLIKDEVGDSFRSVYLFPKERLDSFLCQSIGASAESEERDMEWLRRLPKADLHCHLGGCQDAELLKELSACLLDDCKIDRKRRTELRKRMERVLEVGLEEVGPEHLRRLAGDGAVHCLQGLETLWERCGLARHEGTAILLDALPIERILLLSRDGRLSVETGHIGWPGLERESGVDPLKWYMACGDLGGSALLQTEGCLRRALKRLIDDACCENVRYLEVRCSPDNYTRAGLDARRALEVLVDEARCHDSVSQGDIRVNFIVMATRHRPLDAMSRHVDLTLRFTGIEGGPRVVGFDLAGEERAGELTRFEKQLLPLHKACVNVTIHAGEMATEQEIWDAIYLLHARRLGHGLRLVENGRMMDFVRDHNITVEMCPSSNRQTNGFKDFLQNGADEEGNTYPLAKYLSHGIMVTVNTDNRFISDTTLSREFLMAARLTKGGLTKGQVLKLVKNGFKGAFLPKDEKDKLLKAVDKEIFDILLDDMFPK